MQNTTNAPASSASIGGGRLIYRASGYAGRGEGKNNPTAQALVGQGPLPRGVYLVGPPLDHPRLGPLAFGLNPIPSNEMFGRSGFLIHGDSRKNPGQASSGCIVLDRTARSMVETLKLGFVVVHQ